MLDRFVGDIVQGWLLQCGLVEGVDLLGICLEFDIDVVCDFLVFFNFLNNLMCL